MGSRRDVPRRTAGDRPGRAFAAVVVAAVVLVGCTTTAAGPPTAGSGTRPATTPAPPTTVVAPTTTTTTTAAPPPCDDRAALDAGAEAIPPPLAARIDAALAHPAWAGLDRSVSVWVEGYGEVAAVDPDRPLLPASNQKVLTALGAALVLDPGGRFHTEVRQVGEHLVLVAGGDPTLRSRGPHSLAALAAQVRAAGTTRTTGVLVDATHFEPATTAEGWQHWQLPTYVGPMSALVVDDNRGRTDPAYLADPALGGAEVFVAALRAAGVAVEGPVAHGAAPVDAPVVASLSSATFADLTHDMLLRSDNEVAESLLRKVGAGSTAAGVARTAAALEPWCLHLAGTSGDGSGLSRADLRSAREWRRLLQAAALRPEAAGALDGLPVAGRTGTLAGRLTGPATAGNVRAKTGTIIGGTSLSGYATTADGRAVAFSIVVNGDPSAAGAATGAIDRLVTAVVAG